MTSYMRELSELQEEAARLASAVLAGNQASVEDASAAVRIEERLNFLREQLNDAPEQEYDTIERAVYEIERSLTFVKAMAKPPDTDPLALANAINRDSYDLALSLLDGTLSLGDAQVRADVLGERLRRLTDANRDTAAGADATIRRVLGEAAQEIRFVQAGGRGTTTSRIAQLMRDRNAD